MRLLQAFHDAVDPAAGQAGRIFAVVHRAAVLVGYFIVEGEVEVQIPPRPLRLGAGAFFGEIALITGGPRTATAIAATNCTLLTLDIADFRDLADRRPELMDAIHEEADRRLGAAKPASDVR